MQWHLDEISSQVSPGAHALLILDRAGWHTTGKLEIPTNITLLPLPPKSPELNPVENIWQFMRDNWLSNRIFKSFDEIVAICCEAWNRLIDQPWKIMSIGLRKWAHRYCLMLSGIRRLYGSLSPSLGISDLLKKIESNAFEAYGFTGSQISGSQPITIPPRLWKYGRPRLYLDRSSVEFGDGIEFTQVRVCSPDMRTWECPAQFVHE